MKAQTCVLPSQGQRSRSYMPTFMRLIESTNIHYCVKLRQNTTSNFSSL